MQCERDGESEITNVILHMKLYFLSTLKPNCLDPRQREKTELNFDFYTLWTLKGVDKIFWDATKKIENKNVS